MQTIRFDQMYDVFNVRLKFDCSKTTFDTHKFKNRAN